MSQEDDDQEHQRASERIDLALEIRYRSAGAFLMSYSVNLSRGGLFIETDSPLPPGTFLELKLKTPSEESMDVRGQVAWVRSIEQSGEGQPPGMGISVHTPETNYGPLIDRMATRFKGVRILLAIGAGQDRARSMLRRHLGATVSCEVIDIEDPFTDLAMEDFDLAVISLDWPHGEDFMRRLQSAEAQTPVITLARREDVRKRARSDLGAIAALENPPGFPELRGAVIHALAAPSSVSG